MEVNNVFPRLFHELGWAFVRRGVVRGPLLLLSSARLDIGLCFLLSLGLGYTTGLEPLQVFTLLLVGLFLSTK